MPVRRRTRKTAPVATARTEKAIPLAKTLGEKGLNIVGKETTQKSDEALLKIIAEGAGKMPANKKLTKDEQKAVLQYSRSLAK